MKKRILILDTYYPAFLASLNLNPFHDYDQGLAATLDLCFGTFDGYSQALTNLGWECIDVIANYDDLQARWPGARGRSRHEIALAQIEAADPDVVFLQDLSFFTPQELEMISGQGRVIAAQTSCALPDLAKIVWLDLVFTSFPFYLAKFEELGIPALYVPLAFSPKVLQLTPTLERTRDIVFVGGIGHQWTNTLPVLRAVAEAFPRAEFYGYGYEQLRESDPIRQCYRGPAWGVTMYGLFREAKIVLNRHGEISQDYANNLRMFEATGCGALLMTELKSNLSDFFCDDEVGIYTNPANVVTQIHGYLEHDSVREDIALRGQYRTLHEHTYAHRMPFISQALEQTIRLHEEIRRVRNA